MIPKRRRRTITISGKRNFWYHTQGRRNDHSARLHLVVLPATGGQLLIVEQSSWPTFTPSFVRTVIEEAVNAGWEEDGSGQFVLRREGD